MPWRFASVSLASALVLAACSDFGEAGTSSGPPAANDGGALDGSAGGAPAACVRLCPLAYWDFDEPAGDTRLLDGSGHGNDGQLGLVGRTAGKHGGALDFASSPGAATVPSRPSLEEIEGTQLSVAFWVWLVAKGLAASDQILFQRPWDTVFAPPYTQFSVEWDYNDTKTVQLVVGNGADASQSVASLSVPEGRWVHVAFVYDGAAVRGFVDGTVTTSTPMVVPVAKRTTDLRFGADVVSQQRFAGKLDDVRIYKGVLTEDEIAALAKP